MKRFAFLFTLFWVLMCCGCDEAPQMLELLLSEPITHPHNSRYTGKLRRVGTAENFGANVDSPRAIEFNGTHLYMLASKGTYPNRGQYLFRLDRETGIATIVNTNARNLGGDFSQGRNFTQVRHVSPNDMTWWTPPQGAEVPDGYVGTMYAICPVLDRVVTIDLQTGFPISGGCQSKAMENFGIHTADGYKYIGGVAIGYTGTRLYMCGVAQHSVQSGLPRMAELF